MDGVQKMKHITVVILCNKFVFLAHTYTFRYLNRSKIICLDNGAHFILMQVFKSVFLTASGGFSCISKVPKLFFQQITDFKHFCVFIWLHCKPCLPYHFVFIFQYNRPQTNPIFIVPLNLPVKPHLNIII